MLQFNLKRRWICFLTGISLSGLGVAFTTRSGLGTTPISSVPYVLSLFTPLTFGMWTLAANVLFLMMQWGILRKKFPLVQLWQLPATVLFGMVIDAGMWLSAPLAPEWYGSRLAWLILGSAVISLGISVQVQANLPCLPADAVVKLIAEKRQWNFGGLKVGFDILLIAIAAGLSFVAMSALHGIREGTMISAVLVGLLIAYFTPRVHFLKHMCCVHCECRRNH